MADSSTAPSRPAKLHKHSSVSRGSSAVITMAPQRAQEEVPVLLKPRDHLKPLQPTREAVKYTISADDTVDELSRHKARYMALASRGHAVSPVRTRAGRGSSGVITMAPQRAQEEVPVLLKPRDHLKPLQPTREAAKYTISADDTVDKPSRHKARYMALASQGHAVSPVRTRAGRGPKSAPSKPEEPEFAPQKPNPASLSPTMTRKITRSASNISSHSFEAAPEVYASYEEPLFMVFGLSTKFFNGLKKHHGKLPKERKSIISLLP
jgi:hypothetical protein